MSVFLNDEIAAYKLYVENEPLQRFVHDMVRSDRITCRIMRIVGDAIAGLCGALAGSIPSISPSPQHYITIKVAYPRAAIA